MLARRSTLGLAALLLAAAPFALAGSGDDHACPHGRAAGTWDLPVGDSAGLVHGALFPLAADHPALVLEAALFAVHPNDGTLEGALFSPLHPDLGPLYFVSGQWVSGPLGHGEFEAVVFRRYDGDHAYGLPVGLVTGQFADPPSDLPHHAGSFVGQWRICQAHD